MISYDVIIKPFGIIYRHPRAIISALLHDVFAYITTIVLGICLSLISAITIFVIPSFVYMAYEVFWDQHSVSLQLLVLFGTFFAVVLGIWLSYSAIGALYTVALKTYSMFVQATSILLHTIREEIAISDQSNPLPSAEQQKLAACLWRYPLVISMFLMPLLFFFFMVTADSISVDINVDSIQVQQFLEYWTWILRPSVLPWYVSIIIPVILTCSIIAAAIGFLIIWIKSTFWYELTADGIMPVHALKKISIQYVRGNILLLIIRRIIYFTADWALKGFTTFLFMTIIGSILCNQNIVCPIALTFSGHIFYMFFLFPVLAAWDRIVRILIYISAKSDASML